MKRHAFDDVLQFAIRRYPSETTLDAFVFFWHDRQRVGLGALGRRRHDRILTNRKEDEFRRVVYIMRRGWDAHQVYEEPEFLDPGVIRRDAVFRVRHVPPQIFVAQLHAHYTDFVDQESRDKLANKLRDLRRQLNQQVKERLKSYVEF